MPYVLLLSRDPIDGEPDLLASGPRRKNSSPSSSIRRLLRAFSSARSRPEVVPVERELRFRIITRMSDSFVFSCVAMSLVTALLGYRRLTAVPRLDQKLLELRRQLLIHAACLGCYLVGIVLFLRSERASSLRSRALDGSPGLFDSDLMHFASRVAWLPATLAAIMLCALLPCLHVLRAMAGFVLEETQRRAAEDQKAEWGQRKG